MVYQLSPGVRWSEIDLTTIIPSVSTTEGAFVGDFEWGPINEVFAIGNELELVRYFHKPSANTFQSWFTAANYLGYAEAIKIVRAANTAKVKNATSGSEVILIKNEYQYDHEYYNMEANDNVGLFAAKYPGTLGNSIRVSVWAGNDSGAFNSWAYAAEFDGITGTSSWTSKYSGANDEMHIIVIDQRGQVTGVPGTVLEKFAFVSKAIDAKNDDGSGNYYVDVIKDQSEWIWVTNHANSSLSNVTTITISNSGSANTYPYNTWSGNVSITGGQGTGAIANVFSNATGQINVVSIVANGTGYLLDDKLTLLAPGASVSAINGGNTNAAFTITLGEYANVPRTWGLTSSGRTFSQTKNSFTYDLTGGVWDKARDSDLTQGYDLFKDSEEWDISLIMTGPHSQTVSEYVVENIAGGTSANPDTGRRDCVVFISPDANSVINQAGTEATKIVNKRNQYNSTSYAVMDSGWKKQFDKYNNVYRWVPLNGDIAGLCARTDFERDPWFSPAGFNRGHIKNVTQLAWNPGKDDRDTLYKNGINPVVQFRGEGVILYGDKTMQTKPSAFDRINVRRLFIVLEKAISKAAKYSLFEFNDEFTRAQFVALVEPYLRDVKGRRGIFDFRVVCDETNNTPEVIDRNEFVGDIYIKPARSINFIQLNFVAVRTGVAFSEVIGKF